MPIVSKKKGLEGKVITQTNLQKLLLPTEFHPKGRVELDPVTRMPVTPKRNVLYKTTIRKGGRTREIEVNGGHAKAKDSVWRIALAGPSRYIWKLLRDELWVRLHGKRIITAPTLVSEEMREARLFIAFLKSGAEEGSNVLPDDFLNAKYDHGMRKEFEALDKRFYNWLQRQEETPELPKLTDVFEFLPA